MRADKALDMDTEWKLEDRSLDGLGLQSNVFIKLDQFLIYLIAQVAVIG